MSPRRPGRRSGDVGAVDLPSAFYRAYTIPVHEELVVVAPSGAICVLDAAGRRLWEALISGWQVPDLVGAAVAEGGLSVEAAQAQIVTTLASWRAWLSPPEMRRPVTDARPRPIDILDKRNPHRKPALDLTYAIGDVPVQIRCDNPELSEMIRAACHGRMTDPAPIEPGASGLVDVVEHDGWIAVVGGGRIAPVMSATNSVPNARHKVLAAMVEASHPARTWLGILHAAGIAGEGQCVLLAGRGGSGKSTLAAAAVAKGAQFVTDDYAPLEQGSWQIWPVPYAPSIKEGSWSVLERDYPRLKAAPDFHSSGRRWRYLELAPSQLTPLNRGLTVSALVFTTHRGGARPELRRLSPSTAAARLCYAGSLLDRRPDSLSELGHWIQAVSSFELVFGETAAAVDQVLSLVGGR